MLSTLFYILLFAIATVIIYIFYSKHKLVIKNPSHLAKIIIGNLLNSGTIIKTTNGYTLKYKSK